MAGQYVAARRQEIVAAVRAGAAAGAGLYLHGLGVVPAAAAAVLGDAGEVLLARFAAYLADEWGLAAATVSSYLFQVRPFVAAHADAGRWSSLGARQAAHSAAGLRPRSAQVRTNSLHILLGFMWQEGLTASALAGAVGSFAAPVGTAPPRGLNPGQGGDLLAAVRSSGPDGVRNEPMVALMLRLALRASEVASLLLEDIDWRSGVLSARGRKLPRTDAHRQAFLPWTIRTGRWRPRRWQASPPAAWPTPGSRARAPRTGSGTPRRAGRKRESEDQPSRSCSVTNPRPQGVPTSRPTSNSGSGHLTAPQRPAPAWPRGRARGYRTFRRAARSRPTAGPAARAPP